MSNQSRKQDRKQGRITKADLIWSAAAVILIFFMHGAGYL